MPFVREIIEASSIVGEALVKEGLIASPANAMLKLSEEATSLGVPKGVIKFISDTGSSLRSQLFPQDLKILDELSARFAHAPAAQSRLSDLSSTFHRVATHFLKDGDENKIDFLTRELTSTTPNNILERPLRLPALFELEGKIKPPTMQFVRELEANHPFIPDAISYRARTPDGLALVEKMAAEGSPPAHFESQRLSSLLALQQRFGASSPIVDGLLRLEKDSGLELSKAALITDNRYLKKLVVNGDVQTIATLGKHHAHFPKLATSLGSNSDAIERAGELTARGDLNVTQLNGFINGQAFEADVAASEITRGTAAATLNKPEWLPSVSLLTKHLEDDAATVARLLKYGESNPKGLWRIGSYLDGAPQERVDAVRRMANAGTLDDPQGLMRLTMFPQQVAERIANGAVGNDYRIQDIVARARDFESGSNYTALISNHLSSHDSISATLLKQFERESESTGELLPAFVERPVDASRAAISFGHNSVGQLSNDLKDATQIILDKFAPDKTLVVLARDMTPFTSILRANGRRTINFPFGRNQLSDASTPLQWLSEVPPNTVVIDSKLRGTMLDAIKQFDPTIEGYMLQSKSSYTALLPHWPLSRLADEIEVFPKITGRSTGFTKSGAALSRLRNFDQEDVAKPGVQAIATNRALLQELGLSDWQVWRYQSFTGVPQSERLALSNPASIRRHLENVAAQRNGS